MNDLVRFSHMEDFPGLERSGMLKVALVCLTSALVGALLHSTLVCDNEQGPMGTGPQTEQAAAVLEPKMGGDDSHAVCENKQLAVLFTFHAGKQLDDALVFLASLRDPVACAHAQATLIVFTETQAASHLAVRMCLCMCICLCMCLCLCLCLLKGLYVCVQERKHVRFWSNPKKRRFPLFVRSQKKELSSALKEDHIRKVSECTCIEKLFPTLFFFRSHSHCSSVWAAQCFPRVEHWHAGLSKDQDKYPVGATLQFRAALDQVCRVVCCVMSRVVCCVVGFVASPHSVEL